MGAHALKRAKTGRPTSKPLNDEKGKVRVVVQKPGRAGRVNIKRQFTFEDTTVSEVAKRIEAIA